MFLHLNLIPTKILTLKIHCHHISSEALCVELTEFLDNIFNMPIFKLNFSFLEILKANMVEHPERVMTIYFFSRYFDFKGPKS